MHSGFLGEQVLVKEIQLTSFASFIVAASVTVTICVLERRVLVLRSVICCVLRLFCVVQGGHICSGEKLGAFRHHRCREGHPPASRAVEDSPLLGSDVTSHVRLPISFIVTGC